MLDLKDKRTAVSQGLKGYTGRPVIRGNQTAPLPPFPFLSYNVTTPAGDNKGTYQKHEDGIDRLMVRSVWSFSAHAEDWDESVMLATQAREWIEHSGRAWLAEHGITVQSTTEVTNRDNILTVEYERKNGFDAVFYFYDEVENPSESAGYIEGANIARKTTI